MYHISFIYYIYIIFSVDSDSKESDELMQSSELDKTQLEHLGLLELSPLFYTEFNNNDLNIKKTLTKIITGRDDVIEYEFWNINKLQSVEILLNNEITPVKRVELWKEFLFPAEKDVKSKTSIANILQSLIRKAMSNTTIRKFVGKGKNNLKSISSNKEFRTIEADFSRTFLFFKEDAKKGGIDDFESMFADSLVEFVNRSKGLKYAQGFDRILAVLTIYFKNSSLAVDLFLQLAKKLKLKYVLETHLKISKTIFQERIYKLLCMSNMPLLVQIRKVMQNCLNESTDQLFWFTLLFDECFIEMIFSLMCRNSVEVAIKYLDFIVVYGYNAIFSIIFIRIQKLLEIFIVENDFDELYKKIKEAFKAINCVDHADEIRRAHTIVRCLFYI